MLFDIRLRIVLARAVQHLKNMQNLRINRHPFLNSFYLVLARHRHWSKVGTAAFLLAAANLSLYGQTLPSSGAAPAAPGTIRSGSSPANTQPGRAGQQLPAGINPSNLPPGVQQQINQRAAQQGQNTNNRTAQPAPGQGNTTQFNNGRNQPTSNDDRDTSGQVQRTDTQVIEDGYERARQQERLETRRKLFGYTLFNDPAMATSFQPNINMATPRSYVVGPGDQLNIRMYGYSEIDFSQTISADGFVYFAQQTGLGPVYVSGLSIDQAKARMVSRLAQKFVGLRSSGGSANTFLEVSLSGNRSIRVTITGDAVRPGTYQLSSLSTVMNAVYQAGGPNETGSFRKVQLIRNNKVMATLDLYDYLLNGTQRNDYRLQDNDNIRFTPYIARAEIVGTVKRNNIFEMLPGETLDRLLFYAGDFAANAYRGLLKVTRLTDRERKIVDVTVPEFKTFVIQDGDLVTVEQLLDRFENQVTVEGAVYRPGQYSLDQNKTLKQVIKTAEGLKGDAFTGRISIVRTREDLSVESLTIDLTAIMNGTNPDIPLQREDQIIIPSRFELAEQATVSVTGEVNQQLGTIQYMANMTLNDALLRSGGLKESAGTSLVEVIRRKKDVDPSSKSAQVAEVFKFTVNRDLSISSDVNKFVLEPFDQVIVRRSPNYLVQTYANVEGEVITPGQYAIQRKDQKISDLVILAGGLTPYAYEEGATLVRLVRLSADEVNRRKRAVTDLADDAAGGKSVLEIDTVGINQPESIGINLKRIMAKPGSIEDILVQEGDLLRIPKLLETVRVNGEVFSPRTVKYRPTQTFQDYISQSGGFTSKSQRRKAYVLYANGSSDRTRKFVFFNVYPRVAPGSEVIVPKKTSSRLTPQQILNSTATAVTSLLSVIVTIIALGRVGQ